MGLLANVVDMLAYWPYLLQSANWGTAWVWLLESLLIPTDPMVVLT